MRVAQAAVEFAPRHARLALALAMLLATAKAAAAEPLLVRGGSEASVAALAGVQRSTRLALGASALAALRTKTEAVVDGFPLGGGGTATLDLRRVSPFRPTTRIEIMEAGGPRLLAAPDVAYFAGKVRGEPSSRVVLVAGGATVRGFVASGGEVHRFGPDGHGTHRSYALRDVDPAAYPPPGGFCLNDAHPQLAGPAKQPAVKALAPPVAASTLRRADVAIETDRELRLKFASDDEALGYLGELLAAATAIYENEVGVELAFSYIRLWGASPADPWTGSDTIDALNEVQEYWLDPGHGMDVIAGSRDLVHFVSGKDVSGGVAYIGAICNETYGFGVSQVFGSFNLASPATLWDVLVFTHEVGHNFGSPHTHCYDPPVDKCYTVEDGCYSGPVVASRGTIMSYCHLLGGVDNVDMLFGGVVSNQITSTIDGLSCLETVETGTCGNTVIEANEQCDDGNLVAGDGCSGGCRFEICGNAWDDPGEECDDGNAVSGDGCSPACTREPLCGDGLVDPGEQCDDGAKASGDGCSASCLTEPCLVLRSGQSVWAKAKVSVRKPGTSRSGLSVSGTFGLGVPVSSLGLGTGGARLMLENGVGVRRVDLTLPAGGLWAVRPGKWIYRDPAGTSGGIRKVVVRDRTRAGVPDVQVKIAGQGSYAFVPEDLPLVVTLILGDDLAGRDGACGRYAFNGGSCRASRGGSRLSCR
jgi:cysteine-rich repeat protein